MDNLTERIKSHPLYQKAFVAFSEGNKQLGMKLMYELQRDTDLMNYIKSQTENTTPSCDYVMITKEQSIPKGYNRNTFSEKTCITTQQCDLPEWSDIITTVEYDDKTVYEDCYLFEFTESQMLYNIKKDNPKQFVGKIISDSDIVIDHIFGKMQKNVLFKLIDVLHVDLTNTSFSVVDLLKKFVNHSYLKEIRITHVDSYYVDTEIKILKDLFKTSRWTDLNFQSNNVKLELTK